MTGLKQVIRDIKLVNIATFENLKFDFWKEDNKKELEREIQADKRLKLGVLQLMPDFNRLITKYEIEFNKPMSEFNVVDIAIIDNEFKRLYSKKINRIMGGI